jgi:hypothetical protein
VNGHVNTILRQLRKVLFGYAVTPLPPWLGESRWRPHLCLSRRGDDRVVAVDVIPSGLIPRALYRQEVDPLLRSQQQLRVIVCVSEAGHARHPEIDDFCKELGIGLKVFRPGLGLDTVVRTDVDPGVVKVILPAEEGWFPRAILDRACEVKTIAFRPQIQDFARHVITLGNDEQATYKLVHRTIERLMQACQPFRRTVEQFMRLRHFETLFRLTSPNASEHVFHSFRVFLAGCPIVDTFYDEFEAAHRLYRAGTVGPLNVEYAWLLASVFHDVGRRLEGATKLIEEALGDEDIQVTISGRETRWLRPEYQNARRTLASLAAYVASGCPGGGWDVGAVDDADAKVLEQEWTRLFDSMTSHAVMSALEFLARVFKAASAVSQRFSRAFVITHAVPAALAILLHDWRIWKPARQWHLLPADGSVIPLAALLIYLDTWDDFKRRGPESPIAIREYCVDRNGANVVIEWGDSELYEKEKMKYDALASALGPMPYALKITHNPVGSAGR